MAITAAWGGSAVAQETTSSIRGTVTDESGAPISGASVSIINEDTGFSRTLSTSGNGQFSVRNLPVGGNYVVIVESAGFQGERVEDISLSIGDTTSLTFDLGEETGGDTIIIVGQRTVGSEVATGPSTSFGLETLETTPSINRDIKDVVRLDPRVSLDANAGGSGGTDGILCAGANPRYNSLTVDGLRLNDAFGLNSNGYPTVRIPFSYDAIEQVSVELAPFGVEYGSFTACNINAVTKSGTNSFHGGIFYDFTNDSLIGDSADGVDFDNGEFDDYRWGFNVGGPIIKDKLFFFAAYEKLKEAELFGGNSLEAVGITQAEYDEIVEIARDVYGYEVSGLPNALDAEDEKILVKLDWNINDFHRASFTYNYNDGFTNDPSDSSGGQLSELNHFYSRGGELNSYSGSVYSDWTENLSTEFRLSYIDFVNAVQPLGGLDQWGEVQIRNLGPAGDNNNTFYLGADDSRHANSLAYELLTYKAKADYQAGNHLLTFGIEREEYDIFNLFVQEVKGEVTFEDDGGLSSIENFRLGNYADFIYENAAGTNDANDAAAAFTYEITTAYIQDEWQATDLLNIVAGIRADFYTSDDKPKYNQQFHQTFGFRNDDNLDGKSVIQPRVGFTYDYSDNVLFRGGFGLFSGGNPNVWISNNYSNNGVTQFEFGDFNGGNLFTDLTYSGDKRPFYDIPDEPIAAVAAAAVSGPANALDPDFEIPSEWKFNLGMTYDFDGYYDWMGPNYTLNLDVLYSKVKEAAVTKALDYQLVYDANGITGPDGRPSYCATLFDNGSSASDDDCPRANNLMLTNASDKGDAFVISASLAKSHDFGLDWTLAYAYTDAEDASPQTSSTAGSNFFNVATFDPNNLVTATSDYEIAHRFTLAANYEKEFWPEYPTTFSLVGILQEGLPYSYTFSSNDIYEDGSSRQLIYVPTGANDPLFNAAASDPGILDRIYATDGLGDYRGQIVPRNEFAADWWTNFDLRISQALPGVFEDHSTEMFMIIENVGNLLNDEWGVLRDTDFPATDLFDAQIDANGRYVYSNFIEDANEGTIVDEASLWSIRFGVKYDF
ncbi:TonB-dependent receptor plug domain-containing protein [Parvularcula flava]|nr:TonB-dependent receptor plug domain-containing protein [Aquisalinus luteolus]